MRYKVQQAQRIRQWQLELIEGRFPSSSVLLTVNILRPDKTLKGSTLISVNEKAAPILKAYMERYRKRILRVLYGCRFEGKPEAMALPFYGVVETADKHGLICRAHAHCIIGLSIQQRKELFSEEENGKLKIKSKKLAKEMKMLNEWLKRTVPEKGLKKYFRVDTDYRRHNGEKLDYLTKNVHRNIEHVVRYLEEQVVKKPTPTDGAVHLHLHNPPNEFTLNLKR